MSDTFLKYGYSFQSKLMACLFKDKIFLQQILDILDPEYFESEANKWMMKTISKFNCPYIMMHMLGNPQNMQDSPKYKDVVIEVIKFLSQRIKIARDFGIVDLIADPGFGFGKTTENNFEILNNLEKFKILDVPLLTGFSRKSMIYKTLNTTSKNALNGTSSLNTIALTKGAKILRVHDVKEAKECIILYEKTISSLF